MSEESILESEVVGDQAEKGVSAEEWMLSEGVRGEGESPDWFKSDKYSSVADQAKAYTGLESKLGSFTGAPEDGYSVNINEDLGVDIPEGDQLLGAFNNWASESGLSQDAHTELLNLYISNSMETEQGDVESEIKKIGDNADNRIQDMVQWGKANLDDNEYETLQNLAVTSNGFHLLEKMRSMSRETQVSAADNAKPVDNISEAKLYELVADPRYQENPVFRSEVEAKFRDFYGSAPTNTIKQ
jgi:hypothetical protein